MNLSLPSKTSGDFDKNGTSDTVCSNATRDIQVQRMQDIILVQISGQQGMALHHLPIIPPWPLLDNRVRGHSYDGTVSSRNPAPVARNVQRTVSETR